MSASEIMEAELGKPYLPSPTDKAPGNRVGITRPRKVGRGGEDQGIPRAASLMLRSTVVGPSGTPAMIR